MPNGAQALMKTLADAGIDVCFSNPGTSEMHFVAALDDEPRMRAVLADVQSGKFAEQWMAEYRAGAQQLTKLREAAANHPIEVAGRNVRALLGPGS